MKKKISRNIFKWVGFLLLVPFIIAGVVFYKDYYGEKTQTKQDVVLEVLDGDTFVLPGKQRIRLKRVKAPEMGYCYSEESKKKLEELVMGKQVTLRNMIVDKFRRIVALVYVDDVLVNEVMLKEGYVKYLGGVTEEEKNLRHASDFAKENKLGVFSEECSPEQPPDPKCLIKGNKSEDSSGNMIYHFPGCSAYNQIKVERSWGDDWFCSEKEAEKAGFVKSKNCYGKKY